MRKTWTISFLLLFSLLVISEPSYAENPDVFQILTGQCTGHSGTSTGFRAKGISGIITALHGVVGCQKINSFIRGTDISFRDLHIIKADVERDVALLSSSELQNASFAGLVPSPQRPTSEQVSVIGYPLGIREQLISTDLKIRSRPQRRLDTLLPTDLILVLQERNSPALDKEVLSIEGHLLPGHSGAPVLNEHAQVVGIANGGLQSGSIEIVWAIPWHDIEWKNTSQIQHELDRLAGLSKSVSFSMPESDDRLSLKIAFNDPASFIEREIYTNRTAHYLVPLPQNINAESITRVFLLKTDDTVLAQGLLNTVLASTDGRYEFTMHSRDGVFVLEVIPVTSPSAFYLVTLVLNASMHGAEVLVDGEPATIIDQTLTTVTLRVEGKETSHTIVVKQGNRCCSIRRLIRRNNVTLTPCVSSTGSCE